MSNSGKQLLLVDAYAQIFRAYYAVRSLSNSKGDPTNAVFAMLKFLLQLEDTYADCDGAFVFDLGRPPHRMALAPLYKANRPPAPEDFKAQLPAVRALIQAFGWPIVEQENWEADDLIACIAHAFPERPILILSGDKDLSQLVDTRVRMLIPGLAPGVLSIRDEGGVTEKFGVPPTAIVDYLALIGDASDNIPGIAGVGPKTAAALLQKFGSIEAMLQHPDAIEKEKLRTKITEGAELLRTNIRLIQLLTTPPEGTRWTHDSWRREKPDYAAVHELAETLELKSLLSTINKRLLDASHASPLPDPVSGTPAVPSSGEMEQMSLF